MRAHTDLVAEVYTDEYVGYNRIPRTHKVIRHTAKEFVRGDVHTNGVESWFSMIRRGIIGIHHWVSLRHLQRYILEFSTRHNLRLLSTEERIEAMFAGGIGKTLPYAELVGPKESEVDHQIELI